MNVYPISRDPGITWNLFCDESVGFSDSRYVGPYIAAVLNEVRRIFIETFGADIVNTHPVLGVLPTADFLKQSAQTLLFSSPQQDSGATSTFISLPMSFATSWSQKKFAKNIGGLRKRFAS